MDQDKLGGLLRTARSLVREFVLRNSTNVNHRLRNLNSLSPLPISGCAEEGKRDEKGS